jgi:hypothetical protein
MLAASIQDDIPPTHEARSNMASDPSITADQEPVPGYLDQDVSRFFYRWGGHLSATLVRIRSRFDGDLDQYLLYLIFLLSELSQTMAASGQERAFTRRRGLNALSLSDITQIPRETARRKLLALTERGYLVRDEDGLFVLGDLYGLDEFFADLKPLFWDAVKVAPGR